MDILTEVIIEKMQTIVEHLTIWATDDPQDNAYPAMELQIRIRNNISIRLELEVYLREILTCLYVAGQKEMGKQLEYEADDIWRGNIICFEHKSEIREIPPLLLLKDVRNKVNHLANLLSEAVSQIKREIWERHKRP